MNEFDIIEVVVALSFGGFVLALFWGIILTVRAYPKRDE